MSITLASVVGAIVAIAIAIGTRPKPGSREHKLVNRADQVHCGLDELSTYCKLPEEGVFVLKTYRQSQSPHQEDRVFGSRALALKAAVSTFKRAKIEHVAVMDSTASEFSFQRSMPDYTGRHEGRKVRWIEIHWFPS